MKEIYGMLESRKNKLKSNLKNLIKDFDNIPKRRRQQAIVKTQSRIKEVDYIKKQIDRIKSSKPSHNSSPKKDCFNCHCLKVCKIISQIHKGNHCDNWIKRSPS